MKYHRGSPLWIVGRICILIVFGIMPIIESNHRLKLREPREAFYRYAEKAHKATAKGDFQKANAWIKCMNYEYQRMYASQTP